MNHGVDSCVVHDPTEHWAADIGSDELRFKGGRGRYYVDPDNAINTRLPDE